MEKLNAPVLGAVAHALSNDRYPKDGVGYVLSEADKRTVERTIREQMVAGVPDEAISAAIEVFARQYAASSPEHQAEWAQRNSADLAGLVSRLPVIRAQISGGPGGAVEKAKALAQSLSSFTQVLGLDQHEDGPDTEAVFRSLPELQGASRRRMISAFSEDRRSPEHAAGELVYAKGPEALEKYLEHVAFFPEFADPDEAGRLTERKLRTLLDDPAVEQMHFVGSWAGEEWGVAGSADWNLILELDKGNFVHLKTSGGWQ